MHDIIVIGGGPAGNNAANILANLGYKVAVLDWRHKLGDKLCTGIVGKECLERFPADGSRIFREARSATFFSPSGEGFPIAKNTTQAYIIDRVSYVGSLATQAEAAGAEYYKGHRVTSSYVDKDEVTIRTSDGQNVHVFKSRALIVASGFGSKITRGLGLGTVGDYALGAQVEVSTNATNEIEVYFGGNIAPGFFAWLTPTSQNKALLGLLSRRNVRTHLNLLTANLQSKGKIQPSGERPRIWGVPLRPLARTFDDRVLVVGDAAGQTKPTTGGGIYYALLSAEMASETLHDAFKAGDLSSARLSSYERQWKSLLAKELRISYYARRFYETLNDPQIDQILKAVASNGVRDAMINDPSLSFDWHGQLISKALSFKTLSLLLRSINPFAAAFQSYVNSR